MFYFRTQKIEKISHYRQLQYVGLRQNVLNLSDTMNNTYMQTVSENSNYGQFSVFKHKCYKIVTIVIYSDYESKFVSPCFASAV